MEENQNFIQNKYGYCYYCICDDCSMVYNLYIEKEYRRKGHAKHLIQLVINEIREAGYDKVIEIEAQPRENSIDTESLIAFYESMGLKIKEGATNG
jgi:ribosomal protein S18 acetylase RimI-like enzyme